MTARHNAFDNTPDSDGVTDRLAKSRINEPPQPLHILVFSVDDWTIVTVSGDVDRTGIADLGAAFREVLRLGTRSVSLDLSGLRRRTPLTVALIAAVISRLRQAKSFVRVRASAAFRDELVKAVKTTTTGDSAGNP